MFIVQYSIKMGINIKKIVVIILLASSIGIAPMVHCQRLNRQPYFVPGSGDMARFSLIENTPVGSPVYQLRGN